MKVITVNKKVVEEQVKSLYSQIDFEPDLIVEILNAGGYIGEIIRNNKKNTGVIFKQIKIHRYGESLKKNIFFKFFLRILPYSITNKLRIYESGRAKKSTFSLDLDALERESVSFVGNEVPITKTVREILIIDDAIDTGRTMFVVKQNLINRFPEADIKIAVLSWTLESSIIKPDYCLYNNVLVRFPWSKDYKGKDFEKKSFSS